MIIWILATLLAFFIKGLCGFANTLVFTSVLGFGVANVNISPVELLLGYPTNLILTWKNRNQLDRKVYIPLSLLVLGGSIPGAILLKNVDVAYLKIFFGIVVILIAIEMFLREYQHTTTKDSKVLLGIIGVLSGLLCGLFGIGALLAAYVGRVTTTTDEFKANISAVFIVENTVRVVTYFLLGVFTLNTLKQTAILIPFMLIGLFIGMKSSKILDERIVKKIVIVLLAVSGMVLIGMNL
ncbi:hypothetical protein SAMN02910298_00714 [Pseudobutyrivibrio sp. YE44]|uniref:sulfite exporter TauE/SafE family protein n=1 Tax=Pseudobutyrivibrio sp. YE44 TaxID=1520802 RepID=UPI0008812172|nr:sulfite exporter TauE/SafE family protein [Pseudobutyrivibrio sp. YE44]SDB13667.1 hypothetical protein SAMN02910298_00714 [Pseudobutyrivibrio sp. YE44]